MLAALPHVGDVRQKGLMVGVELVADQASRTSFDPKRRTGAAICDQGRRHGVIIRPLGDVLVLMPPPAMPMDYFSVIVSAVRAEVGQF